MKLNSIAIALLSLSPTLALAELGDAGFSGEITVLVGSSAEKSNFQTDEAKITDLNSSGKSSSEVLAAPLGTVNYTFGQNNDQQVFFGTTQSDVAVGDFALELGYRTEFSDGTVASFAFMPSLMGGETFEDPYLTGSARKETDISGSAFLVQLEEINGTPFSAELGYFSSEVDKEASGSALISASSGKTITAAEAKTLERDGNGFYGAGSYYNDIEGIGRLTTSINYSSFSADGDAMSYDQYGLELELQKRIDRHAFAVSVEYGMTDYSKSNPIFDKKQSDDQYGAMIIYKYQDIMDWKDWSFVGLAAYENSSSNISFYDQSEYRAAVGLSYEF